MATSSPEAQHSHSTSVATGFPERHRGISDLVRGRLLLEHAVAYLVREQARHARNHQTLIVILCSSISLIADVEQREPVRTSMRNWLEGLTRMQK